MSQDPLVGEVAAIRAKTHELRSDLAELRYRQTDGLNRLSQLEESGAGRDHEKRIANLEAVDPHVLAERVRVLTEKVDSMNKAFYTFAFGVIGSSIAFGFSVFLLLGK
jgi:hypothetical protein